MVVGKGHDEIFQKGEAVQSGEDGVTFSSVIGGNPKGVWRAMTQSDRGLHTVSIEGAGAEGSTYRTSANPEQCAANFSFLKHPIETKRFATAHDGLVTRQPTASLPRILKQAQS